MSTTPTLILKKCGYSRDPWRIGLLHADGHFQELTHFSFPLKRDGLPFLARLQALDVNWTVQPPVWTAAQLQAVWAIVTDTPSWQAAQALAQRGPVAPGGRT